MLFAGAFIFMYTAMVHDVFNVTEMPRPAHIHEMNPPPFHDNIDNTSLHNPVCSRALLDEGIVYKNTWKPAENCSLLNYTVSDIHHILEFRRRLDSADIWFIGDSRVRRLCDVFVSLLNSVELKKLNKHFSSRYKVSDVNIEFTWAPYLKVSKKLSNILSISDRERPTFVFLATSLWYFHFDRDSATRFSDTLLSLYPVIKNISCYTNTKVVLILQDRLYPEKYARPRAFMTNENIIKFNEMAETLLKWSGVYIWRSAHILSDMIGESIADGCHASLHAIQKKAHVLLNIYGQSVTGSWPKENLNISCHEIL